MMLDVCYESVRATVLYCNYVEKLCAERTQRLTFLYKNVLKNMVLKSLVNPEDTGADHVEGLSVTQCSLEEEYFGRISA